MGRKAIRGGVYGTAVALAVEGIIDGAGWAINELKDQVIDPGTKEQLDRQGWCREKVCAPTIDGLIPYAQSRYTGTAYPDSRWIAIEQSPSNGLICYRVIGTESCRFSMPVQLVLRPTTGWDGYTNVSPGTDAGPVSDERLGDAIRPHPDVVNSLLTDPRTGRPVMTPELQQMMDDIKQQIEQREGMPGSDPSPAPDMEDDTAKDDGSPWPSFCGWATVVCDFIEWVKTDDPDTQNPEVPWEEEIPADVTQTWSSGLGGGSCPSAASFTVSLGGFSASPEFSFEGICQFGTIMRPVIIALAAIIAGFIIAGVRGTKDA
ncbi:virulence factor TspB C-terminal domain-related protein [Stenotrophomonas humi]|nr:virulence factor TspB C-terminal domain-related protein [Stenotrophomonas humi]